MSRVAKGNYYRRRTQDWLESLGYVVEVLERTQRIFVRDRRDKRQDGKPSEPRVIFSKHDVWGADLVARNEDTLVFIQVKSNLGDIARGMRELSHGPWPRWVGRWVVYWPRGRRLVDGPEIQEVRE